MYEFNYKKNDKNRINLFNPHKIPMVNDTVYRATDFPSIPNHPAVVFVKKLLNIT